MSRNSDTNTIVKGLWWKFLESCGVHGIQFALQIVLARILDPEHYGILSIMIIFTSLATVFVQNGFNMALIQNKDVKEEDYSSVFWVSILIAAVLYALIFWTSPLIATFYKMPDIVAPLRVLALMLFSGALNSVQIAKVRREMDFRKVFISNVGAVAIAGVGGIVVALMGGGLWALVVQTLLNSVATCAIMWFTVRLRLIFICNLKRVRVFLRFGWKLVVSSLLDTLYQDLRSLVIGKRYDGSTLGFYNRGKQFPQMIINTINGTVKSVMLPALAAEQDDRVRLKALMRRSITVSAYIVFPAMMGLAAVSTSLVSLLLTDKWLPCVPYMMIYCVSLSFYPIHSCNLQAINAVGRSDIFLKLEIIKKTIGIISLAIAVFCFASPIAIAMTGIFTTIISCFINAYPNKKLVNYSYFEQMKDLLPNFLLAIAMAILVFAINLLKLPDIAEILVQCIVGVVFYVGLSALLRLESFMFLFNFAKNKLKKR
ncbi:MAG: lipopolysaccharide biosynthesis protein [Clostridia bacterium]|nr:lipopolysaccharide biosynthesis protein [Clostridia bacterium]